MNRRKGAGAPEPVRARNWVMGAAAAAVTLAGLVVGSEYGDIRARALHPRLVGWISAAVVLLFGIITVGRLARTLSHLAARQSFPAARSPVRLLSTGLGYLIVILAVLSVLNIRVEQVWAGAGLAGVVVGIAAQQSLGNVFAGLVLVLAHPFRVRDRIRVRSGALGGIFDATVDEISLTYVTLRTADGQLKVPNSVMLGAGTLLLPHGNTPPVVVAPTITTQMTVPLVPDGAGTGGTTGPAAPAPTPASSGTPPAPASGTSP
jgi:hypothetical protein